jgi:putative membrane protein
VVKTSKLIPGKYYLTLLIVAFVAVWIWAAIKPLFSRDWLLENLLVFAGVPVIVVTGLCFRLSKLSYTLITVFMVMHVIGSHYTYAEVPFGYTLQRWFGSSRNMYDRLVHFCFGFLLAYPVREVFLRLARVKGFWGYWLPLDLTLAMSATYEIMEWVVAARVDPKAGMAYLGTQGDIWDSQKDMLMAGVGALLAMIITALIKVALDQSFWKEMRASFRIPKDDEPLGEVAIAELIEKDAKRKR